MVPESVDSSRLTNAVGLNSIAFNMSRSAGPAVAGILIALVGAGGSYLVQALMTALTALWAWQLRLPNLPPGRDGATKPTRSFARSTWEGWGYIVAHPIIRIAMLTSAMARFLGMAFTTLLPVFARDVLEVGAAGQGLLLTSQGIGALGSAFLIASLGDTLPKGKLMLAGVAAYGVLELLFSQSQWFAVSLGLMFLIGICHVSANALVQSIVQANAAAEMRGRVMGVWQQLEVCFIAGGLMAGAAAAIWGAPVTVAVMGATCALGALAIYLLVAQVRTIR
jgi:hypothetical protein